MNSVTLTLGWAAASALLAAGCMLPTQPASPGPGAGPTSGPGAGSSETGEPTGRGPTETPAESSGPSAPSVVSVSIKNNCRETVKVFYGEDPKFGSGTHSTIGGNTRMSKQMKPGEMIWLVDDSRNGIGSVSISEGTRDVEILESCTGITGR